MLSTKKRRPKLCHRRSDNPIWVFTRDTNLCGRGRCQHFSATPPRRGTTPATVAVTVHHRLRPKTEHDFHPKCRAPVVPFHHALEQHIALVGLHCHSATATTPQCRCCRVAVHRHNQHGIGGGDPPCRLTTTAAASVGQSEEWRENKVGHGEKLQENVAEKLTAK
jgi:hypothetical protein